MTIEVNTPVREKQYDTLLEKMQHAAIEYEPSGETSVIVTFEKGDPVLETEEYKTFAKALERLMDKAQELYNTEK